MSSNSINELNTAKFTQKSKRLRPLRILVIEPNNSYYKSMCYVFALGMCHIMMGATVMTSFIYSIMKNDVHVVLCSVAYHLLCAEAILSFNFANGWSADLRLRHRAFAHVFLQTCSIICGLAGSIHVMVKKGFSVTGHGLAGFLTTILMCIAFAIGPCSLFGLKNMKIVHAAVGMPAFLLSTICFIFGIFTPAFLNWTHPVVIYVVTCFTSFYTVCILSMCILKCSMRLKS